MAVIESVREPIEQAADDADINLRLFPRQGLAFESPANEILFGGAKGGGKSGFLRIGGILLCMMAPGLQLGLFRRTYRELQDNHMEGVKSFPDILAKMIDKGTATVRKHHVRFWNGSHISLNHLQRTNSAFQHSGRQIHGLLFDEATQLEEEQYRYLAYTVMRLGGWKPPAHLRGRFPFVWSGANPGGPAHAFFKAGFVDNGAYHIITMPNEQGGMRRQFIPSRAEDNPALLEDDPAYLDRLEASGDPVLVRALREGDWSVVAGGMFAEWRATMFGKPWHVHPGFEIPEHWPLWRGADDGYEAAFAGYWATEDPQYKTIYIIDELYGKHMLPEMIARKVEEIDLSIRLQNMSLPMTDPRRHTINTRRLRGALDNAAFTDVGQTDHRGQKAITRGEQMNRLGCNWEPVEKWSGSRVDGIQNLHRLLAPNKLAPLMKDANGQVIKGPDGEPMRDRPGLVFFARCKTAIEQLPQLQRSARNPEDIATTALDHAFDGVRYTVQYRRGGARRVTVTGL